MGTERRLSRVFALAAIVGASAVSCKHGSRRDRAATPTSASAPSKSASPASAASQARPPSAREREPPSAAAITAGRAIERFAADLDRAQLTTLDREHALVFSPTSVFVTLALAQAGARGATRAELSRALHWDESSADLGAAVGALMRNLQQPSGATLEISNAYWLAKGIVPEHSFRELAASQFSAQGSALDFRADPTAAIDTINGWCKDKTRGLIPEIVPAGGLGKGTRLVLANAVYFFGPWDEPFARSSTRPLPFTAVDGRVTDIPTMRARRQASFAETDFGRAVRLSYSGDALSMLVVLPSGNHWFTRPLPGGWLNRMLHAFQPREVELAMPRFEITQHLTLTRALTAMGIRTAFTDKADFGALATGEPMPLSAVYHGARIRVEERGTEAAAATVAGPVPVSPPPKVVDFRVDRPFLFLVYDHATSAVLFWGRIGSLSR